MPKNTSVTLGDQYDAFIRRQVENGRFGSASEAVRAGLRLLEEQELKLEQLRAAIDEGDMSGSPEPFDIEAFLKSKTRG
ncbi:type II toxin-antitoxin system ParD family antitoxin [Mesorhizobium sp. VK23B]|uniref:Type II toxin-antitoxin system ParD family antitoxin n=1 Tax=Mesorhizobium dulcispinae TaxID=3072316 RepID=A0ABU4XLU2_9HYPH|nr:MULTISPECIES: type II toxin-antitoxin system ParD family antitoxin [unclassified Mesorhizobium]MDX8469386.1 type II toxin-antitoxin system ParD family antitoxin [Mesorhizobium sp. VK23B]MDX8475725.1 type II toxin-antitoxin system ParD family antitoxin [Mesorhizobium sp. VK23A]MDX8520318.1 type II toxin-antitoxin system ParD family antitoxin [Mesorhizobium sp. VK23D]